ncbi:MAG: GyrI-like domain-containing protein [Chloroflexota bacterium]
MITEPKFVERSEQPFMAIRTQLRLGEMGSAPQFHGEVAAWLKAHGMAPAGAPFIRYCVINIADRMDLEFGFPVAAALEGDGRVTAGVVPSGRYATITYFGHYENLMEANRVLVEWAKENGVEWDRWDDPNGDAFAGRFEFYPNDPGEVPDPEEWETEVTIKVAD